jgi:hypothetical protein
MMPSPVRIEAQVPTSTYEIHGAFKEWARSVLSVSPDIERLQFERDRKGYWFHSGCKCRGRNVKVTERIPPWVIRNNRCFC